MKTIQEAVEVMTEHLLSMTEPSKSSTDTGETMCAYRGRRGAKCAVGVLISDEEYSRDLEEKTPVDEVVRRAIEASGWPTDTASISLYRDFQNIHDGHFPRRIDELGQLAQQFPEYFSPRALKLIKDAEDGLDGGSNK